MAKDVTTFLSWAAEPEHDERKKIGIKAVILFSTLTALSIYVKRFKWAVIKNRKMGECWAPSQLCPSRYLANARYSLSSSCGQDSLRRRKSGFSRTQQLDHNFLSRLVISRGALFFHLLFKKPRIKNARKLFDKNPIAVHICVTSDGMVLSLAPALASSGGSTRRFFFSVLCSVIFVSARVFKALNLGLTAGGYQKLKHGVKITHRGIWRDCSFRRSVV